jgi:hypothetical protein
LGFSCFFCVLLIWVLFGCWENVGKEKKGRLNIKLIVDHFA